MDMKYILFYSSPKHTNTPAIRNVEYNGIKKRSSTKKKTGSLGISIHHNEYQNS
jgi:hypothetical protein